MAAGIVEDWGYAPEYVDAALTLFEEVNEDATLVALTEGLRVFTLESRDCDHLKVRKKVVALLQELAEVDGVVHEQEALSIAKIAEVLGSDPWRWPTFLKRERRGVPE